MKNMFKKMYLCVLKAIPVCTAIMLATMVNSTASWVKGQDEVPESARRYRKF